MSKTRTLLIDEISIALVVERKKVDYALRCVVNMTELGLIAQQVRLKRLEWRRGQLSPKREALEQRLSRGERTAFRAAIFYLREAEKKARSEGEKVA